MDDDLTLLCTGDLHLGRHPARIPGAIDGPEFSPKAVWESTVQDAIDRDADAVLVSGDVVDRENRFFEAYGPFEAGLERLNDAEIQVVVVSGNHDYDVLPELMDGLDFETVQFLGDGGEWERTAIERDGEPKLYVDGWSFPEAHVYESPLAEYDHSTPTDAPLLGVLHGDLDAPESQYAPIETSTLTDTPADAWLLGHIHTPGVRSAADPFVLYPGSPQPLDPGERGRHGPWVLTVDSTGRIDAEHLPLASLRYDRLDVEVEDATDHKEITPAVSNRVSEHVDRSVAPGRLELLLARVTLTGRTDAHADLHDHEQSIEDQLSFKPGALPVEVETLDIETRPAVDLEARAEGDTPAAYLAELLLALEDGTADEEYQQLLDDARDTMQRTYASSTYNELRRETDTASPDQSQVEATLERQARLLLDELLDQKEGTA